MNQNDLSEFDPSFPDIIKAIEDGMNSVYQTMREICPPVDASNVNDAMYVDDAMEKTEDVRWNINCGRDRLDYFIIRLLHKTKCKFYYAYYNTLCAMVEDSIHVEYQDLQKTLAQMERDFKNPILVNCGVYLDEIPERYTQLRLSDENVMQLDRVLYVYEQEDGPQSGVHEGYSINFKSGKKISDDRQSLSYKLTIQEKESLERVLVIMNDSYFKKGKGFVKKIDVKF